MSTKMTRVRANWLGAFAAANGRKTTVTRQELLTYQESLSPGARGFYGMTLRPPSWLTNGDDFRTDRAEYALPWSEFDAYVAAKPPKAAVAPAVIIV